VEHGFAHWAAFGRVPQRWAAQEGEATSGIARLRDGLAALEAMGTRVCTPFYLTLLAEALALAGKIEEGLAALDNALHQRPSPARQAGTQKFVACAASAH
jgi:predicted ATPase